MERTASPADGYIMHKQPGLLPANAQSWDLQRECNPTAALLPAHPIKGRKSPGSPVLAKANHSVELHTL